MDKLRSWIVGLAVVAIGGPALAQDDEPQPTIARSYSLDVRAGHETEFEDAMREQVRWYERNNETWEWHVWQWETGDDIGSYVFRSPGHVLADLDARSERAAQARAHFMDVVNPHLESISASIVSVMPSVSHWPEDYGEVPMVSVYTFELKYGMSEDFEHVVERIHAAIDESSWPMSYAWTVLMSGGHVPTYALVIPHKSYADMAGPKKPFWAMMHETLGRREAEAVRASLNACVKEEHSGLARFRPDLSYMPGN